MLQEKSMFLQTPGPLSSVSVSRYRSYLVPDGVLAPGYFVMQHVRPIWCTSAWGTPKRFVVISVDRVAEILKHYS